MKTKIVVLAFLFGCLFSGCSSAGNSSAPTPTNLPSLSTETRKDVLTSFVRENGGCQLPCILGLTPGISTQPEVSTFMSYFQINSHEAESQLNDLSIDTFADKDWSGAYLSFFENRINVSVSLASQITEGKVERVLLFGQAMQLMDVGAKKLYGDPYYDDLLKSFSLSTILEVYGQPDQVIIRPFPDDLGHPSPPAQYTFGFVLFYPKQGFVVEYISVREEEENNFVGCPTKSYITQISSWDTNESLSISEAIKYFSNLDGISAGNISEYKQLQDATPLSLADFYNIFRRSNSTECINTSKALWVGANQ
jgi:hypothetical protein